MEKVRFLFQSIKNFQQMGTVIRSGTAMCRKMTHFIDAQNDLILVELGAGDGAITKYILDRMSPEARLFVFEINPELCEVLSKINDDRLILINDSAENLKTQLNKYGLHEVDTIISAIPFLVLPDDLTKKILFISKSVLKTGGIFIQMHYVKTVQKMYRNIFGNVHSYFVPVNIPPGYVFRCVKEEENNEENL